MNEADTNVIKTIHCEEIGPAADFVIKNGFSGLATTDSTTGATYMSCSNASAVTYKKSGRAVEELNVSRPILRSGLNGYMWIEDCMLYLKLIHF